MVEDEVRRWAVDDTMRGVIEDTRDGYDSMARGEGSRRMRQGNGAEETQQGRGGDGQWAGAGSGCAVTL